MANYELNRVGKYWHCYFLLADGARFRRSTKHTDKKLAHIVAADLYRRFSDPTNRAANKTTVEAGARGLMLALEQGGKAAGTLDFYTKKLRHILRVFGAATTLANVTARSVDDFTLLRTEEGAKPHTISKELTALRMLLKHARRRGEFDREVSQVMPVAFSAQYTPKERKLTQDEAWTLLRYLPDGPMRYVAFTLATGGRHADALRARGGDFSEGTRRVLVRGSKTKRSRRFVPLTNMTYLLALSAFSGIKDGDPVVTRASSIRHALRTACEKAGLDPVSSNDLRRSVVHWFRDEGVPLDVVSDFMGHTSTRMVERVYGRRTSEELARTLDKSWINQSQTEETMQAVESDYLGKTVPRDRIELPTRGFSIPSKKPIPPKKVGSRVDFVDESGIDSHLALRVAELRLKAAADELILARWRAGIRAAMAGDKDRTLAILEQLVHTVPAWGDS